MFAPLSNLVPANAIETVSGRYVDCVSPEAETIDINDIAWSLSRQARFAGHTMSSEVYSVAQHSVFVYSLLDYVLSEDCPLDDELALSFQAYMAEQIGAGSEPLREYLSEESKSRILIGALMHDATEAYLVDLPSPVKRHAALRQPYTELERGLQKCIDEKLGLEPMTPTEHAAVVWSDLMALQIEASNLMPSRGRGWNSGLPQASVDHHQLFPEPKHWSLARKEFLETYRRLPRA